MSRPAKHLLPLLAATLAAPTLAANLLTNPSFEDPGCNGNCILGTGSTYITGWTTFLSGVEYFSAATFGGTAPDGSMVIDLANYTYSSGGISQSFATTPGATYNLTFALGNTMSSGRTGDGLVHVEVGNYDQVLATPAAPSAAYVWAPYSIQFVATGAVSTLKFSNTQDSFTHFALVDAVGVSAVPEPATWMLLAGGLTTLAGWRRRRNGRAS